MLDLSLDTTTPSGRLMANVMASFAEYERHLIGQRTSAALQQRKGQGVRLGRPQRMPEDLVERIVHEYRAGRRMTDIARGLEADGLQTVRGGRAWYASTIAGVLHASWLHPDLTILPAGQERLLGKGTCERSHRGK